MCLVIAPYSGRFNACVNVGSSTAYKFHIVWRAMSWDGPLSALSNIALGSLYLHDKECLKGRWIQQIKFQTVRIQKLFVLILLWEQSTVENRSVLLPGL